MFMSISKYKRTQYTFIISYCYSMFSFANMSLRYFQIVYSATASPFIDKPEKPGLYTSTPFICF